MCRNTRMQFFTFIIAVGFNPMCALVSEFLPNSLQKDVMVPCYKSETPLSKGCLFTVADPGDRGLQSCHEFIFEMYCKMGWVGTFFVFLLEITIFVWFGIYICVHLYIWLQYVSAPCTSLTQRKATTNSWLHTSARSQVCWTLNMPPAIYWLIILFLVHSV